MRKSEKTRIINAINKARNEKIQNECVYIQKYGAYNNQTPLTVLHDTDKIIYEIEQYLKFC